MVLWRCSSRVVVLMGKHTTSARFVYTTTSHGWRASPRWGMPLLVTTGAGMVLLASTTSGSQCDTGSASTTIPPPDHQPGMIQRALMAIGLLPSHDRVAVPLPTDKLQCHQLHDRFGRVTHTAVHKPVVLVSCGSFNPPTCMHVRMFEVAAHQLAKMGFDVLGGYMSPVSNMYGKKGLVDVHHRVNMCHLAAETSPLVMVDEWEASQYSYVRTIHVLDRVKQTLEAAFATQQPTGTHDTREGDSHTHTPAVADLSKQTPPTPITTHSPSDTVRDAIAAMAAPRLRTGAPAPADGTPPGTPPAGGAQEGVTQEGPLRVMLLCGADLLATMVQPGVWQEAQLRRLLDEYGVVAVGREGTSLRNLVTTPNTLLYEYRHNIIIVDEPVSNGISSTLVRTLLTQGEPVRYLIPEQVLQYIHANGLYTK